MACISPDWFFRAVRRQLFPPDHLLVIERNYLDQQAAARGQAPASDKRPPLPPTSGIIGSKSAKDLDRVTSEAGAQKQTMVKAAFDSQQRANTGYVPPYDPKSQFYNVLSNGQMAPNASQGQSTRNPVLQVLDAQFAANQATRPQAPINNPYRGKHPFGGISSTYISSSPQTSDAGERTGSNALTVSSVAAGHQAIDTTDPAQVIVANPHLTEPEAQILSAYASSLDK